MKNLLHRSKLSMACIKFAWAVLCLIASLFSLRAQDFKYKIYFPFDDSRLSVDCLDNRATLAALDSMIRICHIVPGDSLEIMAVSSPEGRYAYNYSLSEHRAETLRTYLLENYPEYTKIIITRPVAEAWDDLRDNIAKDRRFSESERREILDIIDSDAKPDRKEALLKKLPAWKALYKRYFKRLRYAYIVLSLDEEQHVLPDLVIDEIPEEEIELPEFAALEIEKLGAEKVRYSGKPEPVKPRCVAVREIFAVKTNLLYDAVTALNVELEVPIANRFSIMAEDVFPWWETGNKYCFQMWEMGLEGRYWFKPWASDSLEKMRGFFAGVYGMSSKYDFQFDREIDYQGEYWSAGISGGYVMPIGRKKRWNLEFSLALGYLQTDYRHYNPTDEYDRLIRDKYVTGTLSYFGPTKAKVSLILPIYTFKRVYD